ncbi:NAD(P)H-quinone oxidoreductase [Paenibacillus arenosi]|nr:NAD(P)H-quinone oxidoreductase [Paenibacillus arenosi]
MEEQMIACLVNESKSLYWGSWTKPKCTSGELLIRVEATALNRADLLQKRGLYAPPKGASPIIGLEMAGVVEEVGSSVEGWEVGDRICALLPGGGYAQYVTIPAELAIRISDKLTFVEAAAIPEVFLTAYLNMFELGRLKAGEHVLIHAAASGVGTAAVQLAKAAGAFVIATVGTDEKADAVERLDADVVINYRNQSFEDAVMEYTNGKGVDMIMDPIGASYWKSNMEALAMDGRLILFGVLGGSKVEKVDLLPAMMRRIHIITSTLRGLPIERKAALTASFVDWAMPLIENGEMEPIIDSVWEADEINEAHARMERNENIGKMVVLVP